MKISRTLVPALALTLFTAACARHAQHGSRPRAQAPVATVTTTAPAEVTTQPTEIGPVRARASQAFKVVEVDGENKGKCTKGYVATYRWHQANRPALEATILAAIDELNVAKQNNSNVAEAGRNVRRVYDEKMATIKTFEKNYGTQACETAGSPSEILGADQLQGRLAYINEVVKTDPAIPARKTR